MEIGEKLATARRYHAPALGQKDLAALLGVDTSTVGRWESKNHIPPQILPRVAALLNVKEEWFFNGDDTPPTVARRVPMEEPSNVRDVASPQDHGRTAALMVEGQNVALPVWRGVIAGAEDEISFSEDDAPEFREIPAFYTLGKPDRHVLVVAQGMSMAPRIAHAEQALIQLTPDVPPGRIVAVRAEDGRNFIKKLVSTAHRLELHSLNDQFKPIQNIGGWTIRGGTTMIRHNYEPGIPNIEWDDGRFLRA